MKFWLINQCYYFSVFYLMNFYSSVYYTCFMVCFDLLFNFFSSILKGEFNSIAFIFIYLCLKL